MISQLSFRSKILNDIMSVSEKRVKGGDKKISTFFSLKNLHDNSILTNFETKYQTTITKDGNRW